MSAYSRPEFWTACTILVLLACMAAGCTSYQTAPVTAAPPAVTGGGNTIAIKNFAFEPASLAVKTGTTVSWTNQDSAPHTIVSDTSSPVTFSSESLSTGGFYTFTFNQAGTYTYHCSIHPSMKGMVVVQ